MWMRQRRQRPPRWQRWLQEAIKSYEGRQFQACLEQAQKAEKAFEKTQDIPQVYLGLIQFYIGRAQLDLHFFEAAEGSLLKAKKTYTQHPPEDPMYQQNLDLALGELYHSRGQLAAALPYFEKTMTALQKAEGEENGHEVKLVVYQRLAELEEQLRNYEKAINYYEGFLEAFSAIMGADHPAYQRISRHRSQLTAALAAREAGFPSQQIEVRYPDGQTDTLKQHYGQWLVSPHPDPTQESLTRILKKAKSVRVQQEQIEHLIEDRAALASLKAAFRIESEKAGHKLATTGVLLTWLDEQYVPLAAFLSFSDGTIRWEQGWKDDAKLDHPQQLQNWLEKHLPAS